MELDDALPVMLPEEVAPVGLRGPHGEGVAGDFAFDAICGCPALRAGTGSAPLPRDGSIR